MDFHINESFDALDDISVKGNDHLHLMIVYTHSYARAHTCVGT